MFFTVAYNCPAKEITVTFTVKRKDSRKNKRPRGKKKKTHCKRKNLPVPTLSFMPRRNCYFFCREVISLAVSLLLLICREGFFFLPWGFFRLAVRFFSFAVRLFLFGREVLHFAVSIFLCWEVISFTATVVGHRSFFDWFRILASPP